MIDEEALRSIEKLHQMKQGGIISEADFETAKQGILQGKSRNRLHQPAGISQSTDHPDLPSLNDPAGWAVLPLKRYAVFAGRSGRREFWMFQIITTGLSLIFWSLVGNGWIGLFISSMALVGLLGLLVPQVALQVRRFHDQGKSGWFALLNLFPFFGPLIVMIFMLIEGTHGENEYGPDPYNR